MYPKNNPESWQRIHEFVDWFSDDDPHWSRWKPMVRRVLLELEQRGLVSLFRAGQSMHHIMFSTLDHHGLEAEPRVTLEIHVERGLVRVAYSTANLYFCEPLAEEYVPVEGATAATLAYLRRLWIETKAGQPLPDALRG
jgi:hypothetical protein